MYTIPIIYISLIRRSSLQYIISGTYFTFAFIFGRGGNEFILSDSTEWLKSVDMLGNFLLWWRPTSCVEETFRHQFRYYRERFGPANTHASFNSQLGWLGCFWQFGWILLHASWWAGTRSKSIQALSRHDLRSRHPHLQRGWKHKLFCISREYT